VPKQGLASESVGTVWLDLTWRQPAGDN